MPTSKITATDKANGLMLKKIQVLFLAVFEDNENPGRTTHLPCARNCPSTMTGTSTWFTLLLILNNSSFAGPPLGCATLRHRLNVHRRRRSDSGA